ncbi:MAG: hypothetical protein AAFV95_29110 [Bacteroidota bacterium]
MNISELLTSIDNLGDTDNPRVLFPSSDGFGCLRRHVWVCGKHVYQLLTPDWCGTCYLARLLPHVGIYDSLTHYHANYPHYYSTRSISKREVPAHRNRVSVGAKFVGGLLPWWGTVNLAHQIDDLAIDLENLTAESVEGFTEVTTEVQALRNMELQDRMVLDLMLAAHGGVCHVVGESCCTFVPDITDNMTHVISHLNGLLQTQRQRDSAESGGFDPWTWLTSGSWYGVILKMFTPVLIILVVFFLLFTCVIPCIRHMMLKAMTTSFLRDQRPDPFPDINWGGAPAGASEN